MREIEWFDHESVKCPHCGEENGDLFDVHGLNNDGDESKFDCGSCGKEIEVIMSVDVTYGVLTQAKEQQP